MSAIVADRPFSRTHNPETKATSQQANVSMEGFPFGVMRRPNSNTDFLMLVREKYQVLISEAFEQWLKRCPGQVGPILEAADEIDRIFGSGRSKWISLMNDWEGSTSVHLEVEFSGSGEQASEMRRRFIDEWLVDQPYETTGDLTLGVRFV